MKMPEFIPFHFDKFTANLSKKHGCSGVGRWMLIKKAVAETDTLTLNINDPIERETLELDTYSTPEELTAMLDHAAQRGMIDPMLYGTGIIWIEKLDEDLGAFYRGGKRKIPQRPAISRKISETLGHLSEKFHEVPPSLGIPEHEHAGDARAYVTNERTNERTNSRVCEGESKDSSIEEKPNIEAPPIEDDKALLEELSKHLRAVTMFTDNYGKYGRAAKPASIDQAFRDAVRRLMELGNMKERDARIKIVKQADAARLTDERNEVEPRYRISPEKWLNERCYENVFDAVAIQQAEPIDYTSREYAYRNFTPD